jgi:hypothetical protein
LNEHAAAPHTLPAICRESEVVLATRKCVGYTHNMQVLHSDNRRRVTLPEPARPKDSWIPEVVGHNQILLTRVEKPSRPKAKLIRRGGLLLLSSKRPISWEETRKALDEFP